MMRVQAWVCGEWLNGCVGTWDDAVRYLEDNAGCGMTLRVVDGTDVYTAAEFPLLSADCWGVVA